MTGAVEISDDPAHPEGGHALVRFRGATGAAGPTRLAIEPLTDGYDYRGPRQVDAIAEIEEDGLLLAVGGGQLDQLATGVAVLLSVPEAGLSAEVLWPEVRPLVLAPRRTPVRTSAPRRVVDGAAPAARTTGPSRAPAPSPPAPNPRDAERPQAAPPPQQDPPLARQAEPVTEGGARAQPPASPHEPDTAPRPGAVPPAESIMPRRDEASDAAIGLPVSRQPAPEPAAAAQAVIRRGWRWPAVAAVGVLAFGIGAAAAGAALLMRPPGSPPRPSLPPLFDALTAGDVSPLGTLAATVKPDDLFDQASSFLRGVDGHSVNLAEGTFWLKRALAGAPDDARQRRPWALMRIGLDVYGAGGTADHAAGRELLQIAAAWNNAFAMCRLGEIEDHGDDVSAPDRPKAILWYERAKLAGCKDADEALARLKR